MVWDPLRKKEVPATPEEKVRQWFISELSGTVGVPQQLMNSEVAFSFGQKNYRADILVFDRNGKPLAVVECKRDTVELGPEVIRQAMRYNAVLDVRFIFITNGRQTFIFRREGENFLPLTEVPTYESMLCQH